MVLKDEEITNSCKQVIKELEQQIYELKQENRGLRKEIHKIRPPLRITYNRKELISIEAFTKKYNDYHSIIFFYYNDTIDDEVLESVAQDTYDSLVGSINE